MFVQRRLRNRSICARRPKHHQGFYCNPVAFVAKAQIKPLLGDGHHSRSQHRGGYCIVSVSGSRLLLELGSKTPFGAVTVAVSEILPCAEALIVPVAL